MVFALLLTAVLAWSDFTPPDSSTLAPIPERVDLGTVALKTLVFPSWGAWEAESPALACLELILDLSALFMLREAPNLHGEGQMKLLLVPMALGVNRLLSLPLNLASGYGEMRSPTSNGEAFGPGRHRFRIGVALLNGGFGSKAIGIGGLNLGLGIPVQFQSFRLMPYGYFPNSLSADRFRETTEHTVHRDWWLYGLEMDHAFPLFSWVATTPGVNLNFGAHQKIQYFDAISSNFPPYIQNETDLILTPKLGIRLCPFTSRLQLEAEAGLNIPLYQETDLPNGSTPIRGADFKIQASAWF